MKILLNTILVTLMATSLTGCIVIDSNDHGNREDWQITQRENNKIISSLELQTPRKNVVSQLGAPSFSEAFSLDGNEFKVLYYRTQHQHSDGDTTKDETTPLIFKNDQLIGWGEASLRKLRH